MSSEILELIQELINQPVPFWLLLIVLLYAFKEPIINAILYLFRSIKFFHRKLVARKITKAINYERKRLQYGGKSVLSKDLKIKWVKSGDARSILKEDKVIVFARKYEDIDKTMAHVAYQYVKKALLPMARRYVAKELMESIDLIIIKSLIRKYSNAIIYLEEIYGDQIEGIRDIAAKIEKIHELGYLTRILINQYSDLKQLFPKEPTSEIRTETKDFMKLVYRLATKSPEEDIDPIFPGRHISVALVLVGRSEKLETMGLEPYINFIKRNIRRIKDFYILAAGGNIAFAKLLINKLKKEIPNLELVFTDEYTALYRGIRCKTLCALLRASFEE